MFLLFFKALIVAILGLTVGFKFGSSKETTLRQELLSFVRAYDFKKINGLLSRVRKQPAPQRRFLTKFSGELPSEVTDRFHEINQAVFGKNNVVEIFAAEGDYSQIHNGKAKIGFPPELLVSIDGNRTLLDFTLAHAMAHYIYEFYIDEVSQDQLSLHGLPSRKNEGTNSDTAVMAAAHAEVDAIALAIMFKMGHKIEKLGPALIQDFVNNKKLLDKVLGIHVNELTSFDYIPEDFRPRVRDNYVRVLSLQNALARLRDG